VINWFWKILKTPFVKSSNGILVVLISKRSKLNIFWRRYFLTTVGTLIDHKKSDLITVKPSDKVELVLELMRDHRIRSVLVANGSDLLGIVSQGDCAIKVLLPNLNPKEVLVSQIMTADPLTVLQENTLEECMAIMVHKHIRHLPVLEKKQLIGVVSIGDIVKNIIETQGKQIEFLESYITGVRMS